MKTVRATDDPVIEMWEVGEVIDRSGLRLRGLCAKLEGERQMVVIHPEEARPLIDALARAAGETADQPAQRRGSQWTI